MLINQGVASKGCSLGFGAFRRRRSDAYGVQAASHREKALWSLCLLGHIMKVCLWVCVRAGESKQERERERERERGRE